MATVPIYPPNRYRSASSASIVYKVVKLEDGWKIEAIFDRRVSAEDRRTVIQWFQQYRSNLRRQHPLWVANFRSLDNGYALEVKPVEKPRDLMEKGQNLKGIWTDEIANRA